MAKISLHLDKRRNRKDEKFPLAIRINHQKSNRLILLKVFITEDQWNKKNQEIRRVQNSVRLTATIQNKLSIAKNFIAENEKKIAGLNINELKEQLEYLVFKKEEESDKQSGYLEIYGKSIIERTIEGGKLKTADWYQDSINSIKNFNKGKDILMGEIDVTFLEKYKAHCLNKAQTKNSISARLRALRAIMNKAQKEGESFLSKDHKPFENFQIPSQKTPKRAVSKDVINLIRTFPLDQSENQWHTRNYFLFMFNMQGMNFIDYFRQIGAGFYVNGDIARACFCKLFNIFFRVGDHEVNIQRKFGGAFAGLDEERADGDGRDEVSVHDVHVEPVGGGGFAGVNFFGEAGKV